MNKACKYMYTTYSFKSDGVALIYKRPLLLINLGRNMWCNRMLGSHLSSPWKPSKITKL